MISGRKKTIEAILEDLREFSKTAPKEHQYAVAENLAFFEATKHIPAYIFWLAFHAPFIDGGRLLEIADFPFPRWDRELHTQLLAMEKKKFPGLITPLRDAIVHFIQSRNPAILMDLGCGAMEVERQVIKGLADSQYKQKLIFIGVDQSAVARELAENNLQELQNLIEIKKIDKMDAQTLAELQETPRTKLRIVLCKNDVFELDKDFNAQSIDLVFHSKFKHHISEDKKAVLDEVIMKIGKTVMEFDDYKSWPLLIPPSLVAWKYPVLLNGAILSRLRDLSRKQIGNNAKGQTKFYGVGSYLTTYTQ